MGVSRQPAILLVEDERIVANDLRQTLAELGYDAFAIASSGEEALARAGQRRPDLVLMDIHLSGEMDGIAAAALMRERFGVPVVYLTAHADSATVDRAKRTEPYGYLTKPVTAVELRSVIEVSLYKHEIEKRLREREQWLETTLRSIGDAVTCVDVSGKVTFMNPAAEALTGVAAAEAAGRPAGELLPLWDEKARKPLESPLATALRERRAINASEGVLMDHGGEERVISSTASPVLNEREVLGAVMVSRDVTEPRRAQQRLEVLTKDLEEANTQLRDLLTIDPLTKVLNRLGIEQLLLAEIKRPHASLIAILIDLDALKEVNDTLGHAVGDALLRAVAQGIRSTLRKTDALGRIGGDEFLVLLPETRVAEGMAVAERIRATIERIPSPVAFHDSGVTGSLGVAWIQPDTRTFEEVLAQCHRALKASKVGGKNQVSTFDAHEGEGEPAEGYGSVLIDLPLHPVCQRIVRLDSDETTGYEILIRGPRGPLERPDELFERARKENVLVPFDLRCLRACLEACRSGPDGYQYHVNALPSTIVNTPGEVLREIFGSAAGNIFVELSEQQFIGDPNSIRGPLQDLKEESGIRIALDDVGFGRSSLEALILLEPDCVKIDRRWVAGLSSDRGKQAALKRLLSVARVLGANLIAEGIETLGERAVARELGIELGQGFLWGRPFPVARMDEDTSMARAA